eukprot:1963389-Lingulodinium_polyedra.AAC.1
MVRCAEASPAPCVGPPTRERCVPPSSLARSCYIVPLRGPWVGRVRHGGSDASWVHSSSGNGAQQFRQSRN